MFVFRNLKLIAVIHIWQECLKQCCLWYIWAQASLTPSHCPCMNSPYCSDWPAPMKTPQDQQRELSSDGCADFNAWLESDLVLFINFNSIHNSTYMTHDLCYLLLFIIGTDIKFNHNSAIHSSGHLRGPFTSASDYAPAQWRLLLHILVTCSPHVNKCWVRLAIYGIRCGWSH